MFCILELALIPWIRPEPRTSGLEKTAPSGELEFFLYQTRKTLVICYSFLV